MKKILGGANLFMPYGISNHSWQNDEILYLLDYASSSGFELIDTAFRYNNSDNPHFKFTPFSETINKFKNYVMLLKLMLKLMAKM